MSNLNLEKDDIDFIDEFFDFLNGLSDKFYESCDISDLEKIISILKAYGVVSGAFYNRIKSILDRKKEEKRKEEEKENEDKKKSNKSLLSEIDYECEDNKRKIQNKITVKFDI